MVCVWDGLLGCRSSLICTTGNRTSREDQLWSWVNIFSINSFIHSFIHSVMAMVADKTFIAAKWLCDVSAIFSIVRMTFGQGPNEGITDVDTYRDCLRTLQSQAVVEAKTNFVPESLELHHLISHLLKVCCLGRSVPLSPGCVLVTVGFWTVTRPASPAAYQMFVRSVEWHHTP